MACISYIEVDAEELDKIKPLWEKLVEHIKVRSTHFSDWFETRTFEKRKAELMKKSDRGKLHINLAVYGNEYIGYCVSSVCCKTGEIDSIFVEENHRSYGIGGEMMKRALAWMEEEQAESVNIAASIGDEDVLPFYQHYGFFPKRILLKLKM